MRNISTVVRGHYDDDRYMWVIIIRRFCDNPTERFDYGGQNVEPSHESNRTLDEFIEAHKRIRDKETHP
jgi:hypothetical protein